MVSACVDEKNFIRNDGTTHQFKVNYFKSKDLSPRQGIGSSIFKSAGYKWIIRCYPKGFHYKDFIAIFLEIRSDCTDLMVNFNLDILGKSGSEPFHRTFTVKYTSGSYNNWGVHSFIKITNLEESYVTEDGYFQILCSINWMDKDCNGISLVPIGDVKEDISKLWQSGEMSDVNFEVDGEIISAHRVILAARSSVFKAELFGNTAKGKIGCIRIEDMKPAVFRALLHFIYNNSLDNERGTYQATSVMTQHLLAAASRYAIKGLIVRCEDFLMENLSLDTVLDVLILAEGHHLSNLKEACLEFAARQKNITKLALTDGYNQMAQAYPSLWTELSRKEGHQVN